MKIVSIVPARMKSGRFPGKPMAKILGMPMIGHCYLRSRLSKTVQGTYAAVCDQEVFDYVRSLGGEAIMTKDTHEMCTDRVVEATLIVEKQLGSKVDVVVNIQGDQPMVYPEMVDAVVRPLMEDPTLESASLMYPMKSDEAHDDPNRIKIVVDKNFNLLYMSREPIPSRKKWKPPVPLPRYVHVALTAFRRDFLMHFGTLPMSPLERVEAIDNLRVIENGYRMKMAVTDIETETVDVPHDIEVVERMMKGDPLLSKYRRES
jgi:3-deoxy-manno-octulosonate cytidylyltransferase (CMP-KDO synthetase)